MADPTPWLSTMRMITGTKEASGDADNPKILAAAQFIGDEFPEMESYCDQYTHDSIAWCGLCCAYVMAANGIRPQFGPAGDTDKFLWAQSWLSWGQPCMPVPGAVMIFTREGGGHVTLLEEVTSSGSYKCRGGNQSDMVNVSSYSSGFLGSRWPPGYEVPRPDPGDMPEISLGDTGPAVMEAQRLLGGLEIDGEFGPATDSATRSFQASQGLEVDGVIGPDTWEALYASEGDRTEDDLPAAVIDEICSEAAESSLASYSWRDRGVAPIGYIKGLAVTYGYCFKLFNEGDEPMSTVAMPLGPSDKDALKYLANELKAAKVPVATELDRLRATFCILYGLGMRESSGKHCEGTDVSASGGSSRPSDEIEAGLFQTSWNAHNAHDTMDEVFDRYVEERGETGFVEIFREGVSCSASSWQSYGSGDGRKYQDMSKAVPAFHVEFTAIGLRVLRKHWGPIERKELEIKSAALTLLKDVEDIVTAGIVEPGPSPGEEVSAEAVTAEILNVISSPIEAVLRKYRITEREDE